MSLLLGAPRTIDEIEEAFAAIQVAFNTLLFSTAAVAAVPIGSGLLWYTSTPPSGYLLCDGSSVSRTTYPGLFAVIGTTYGSAGATLFTLPDLRQRFPLGKAASGTGNSLAGTGGAIDHTHTVPIDGYGSASFIAGRLVVSDGSAGPPVPMVCGGSSPASGTANPPYLVVNYVIKY